MIDAIDPETVRLFMQAEIMRLGPFENWHGITPTNINSFLVQPQLVEVDLDDALCGHARMWLVLKLSEDMGIVCDPRSETWGVVESVNDHLFQVVICTDGLREALEGM